MTYDHVFLRLATKDGDVEDHHLGTLYVEETADAAGVVLRVAIEGYGGGLEERLTLYFDDLDQEAPEIPGEARIKPDSYWVATIDDPAGDDWVYLDEEDDEFNENLVKYAAVVRGAQRLLERVRRQEPILVGPEDIEESRHAYSLDRLVPHVRRRLRRDI